MAASLGEEEGNLLGVGASVFALGVLAVSGGLFLKTQGLKSPGKASGQDSAEGNRRGGCDICHKEAPVVHCRVHQYHLCGKCLGNHYDFRSCVYIPSTRRGQMKTAKAKSMSAKAHG